jgi:hypothetical protein
MDELGNPGWLGVGLWQFCIELRGVVPRLLVYWLNGLYSYTC